MPNCKTLENEEYKKLLKKLEKVDVMLEKATEDLLENHRYAEILKGKITVKDREVIVTDDLDFEYKPDVYLPAVIDTVKGYLDLGGVYSAEHLELPEIVDGSLYLDSLKSATHLKLPEKVKGNLWLRSLKSARYLELPENVEGNLRLSSLESTRHLELHDDIDGEIIVSSLTEKERENLRDQYPNLANQITAHF